MARGNAFSQILPPSASASGTSSTPPKSVRYDVFINHRGPDTKNTVAASIYNALKPMGVEVFLDEQELDFGDSIPAEIQDAIASSFLHVAILSPRYAESPWCLEELSLMLKTGQKIIPIFCEVDPGGIRWKNVYAEAFSRHEAEDRYSSRKLEDWKLALNDVSLLTGPVVNNNEGDEEMLEIITSYVLKHPYKISFEVAKYPVGLAEILRDFERIALKSSEKVKIVGITGMIGCGITTLANEYYEKKRRSIFRCSFICNVRDELIRNLLEKQKKLFQDLGGSKETSFDSVEEGKAFLKQRLKLVQVFIILDNADHPDQLDSLLPVKDCLKEGSVIVVTSHDINVLMSWGIPYNFIYKMKELNSKNATELFCRHAFLQPSLINEIEYPVKRFVEISQGLPLYIKVLGGLVRGKPKEYWYSLLDKISRLMPKDIKNKLKVSIDGLDEFEREIFLDICCFFIGTETHSAITVWNEAGFGGACGLETLVDKNLVEVDEDNRLRMHDTLRDLGKEISDTQSLYCRLWSPKQISLIEGKENVLIRGIKVETEEFYKELMELVRGSGERFTRHLKILHVENNYFTEELARLSARIVWLRLINPSHTAPLSLISLKKLRVLELRQTSKSELLTDTPEVKGSRGSVGSMTKIKSSLNEPIVSISPKRTVHSSTGKKVQSLGSVGVMAKNKFSLNEPGIVRNVGWFKRQKINNSWTTVFSGERSAKDAAMKCLVLVRKALLK